MSGGYTQSATVRHPMAALMSIPDVPESHLVVSDSPGDDVCWRLSWMCQQYQIPDVISAGFTPSYLNTDSADAAQINRRYVPVISCVYTRANIVRAKYIPGYFSSGQIRVASTLHACTITLRTLAKIKKNTFE